MHLLIDPIVLCLPKSTKQTDIDDFVQYILAWSAFLTDNRNTFYITQECDRALCQYPLDCFRNRPDTITSRVQDRSTILRASGRIINYFLKPNHFLQIENLPELLVYCDEIGLNPDLVERTHDEFTQRICEVGELTPTSADIVQKAAESLQEAFGYVAYAKEICQHPILSNLLFLTHPINGNSDKIAIKAPLETQDGELPPVTTDLSIVGTPEDLLRLRNLTDIWEDTGQAIDSAKDPLGTSTDKRLSPYTVGPGFNQSLQDCQFPTHPNRLDRCFKKIARLLTETLPQQEQRNTREHKPLFEGRDRNGIQKTVKISGRAWTAWRLRITGGGNAYRLHYWYSDGEYILSNVVPHDGVNIDAINKSIVSQIK